MAGIAITFVDWAAPQLVQEVSFTNTVLRWLAVLGLTFVGAKWLNNLSLIVINMIVYRGDIEAAALEATDTTANPSPPEEFAQTPAARTEMMNFLIVDKPDAPYARYQDADIFEWLDVEDDTGTVRRMLFEGTVDMKKGLPNHIEPGTLLLPPGILYKFVPVQ